MSNKLDPDINRLQLIVPVPSVKKVDYWRRKETQLPNVWETILRLVEMGLESAKRGKGR